MNSGYIPDGFRFEPVSAESGSLSYAVANPMTFLCYTDKDNADWLECKDDSLWGAGDAKSIYDPCPPGWRVPEADFWASAFGEKADLFGLQDSNLPGMDLSGEGCGMTLGPGPSIWYPAAGGWSGSYDYPVIEGVRSCAFCWSSGVRGRKALHFSILGTDDVVRPVASAERSRGFSVRCRRCS